MYRKNTAGQFVCVQLLLTASGAVATGLTPAARRCIDGTFAAGGGTFTEDGTTGSYKYALAQADTNGNNISIIVTAAGAIPVCVNLVTTAADPTNATTFGLTNLDAAVSGRMATYTQPTGFLAATFPATLASTTNITAGTVTTATNVTTVNGLASGIITAASIAADAITAAKIADGAIDAATFAAGAINAAAIAADAISDAKVAADVTIASVTGAVGSVTGAVGSVAGNVGGNVVGSVASVTAGVTVTTNNDKTGYGLSGAAVQAIWDALTSALTTVGSIGKLLVDNINATISSRSTYAGADTSGTVTLLARLTSTRAGLLDNLDAAVSTRSSQTSVDDLPTNAELATALSGADDATLAAIAALNNLSAAQVNAEVDTALADYDGPTHGELTAELATIPTASQIRAEMDSNSIKLTSIDGKTTNLPSDPADESLIIAATDVVMARLGAPAGASLAADLAALPNANAIADAQFDRADAIEVGLTHRQAMRLLTAILGGKLSGAATATNIFRNAVADDKDRVIAIVTSEGNHTAIAYDLTD